MAETSVEWLDRHTDRIAGRQRSQVDTAKLIATFSVSVAATLVGTTLQVPGGRDGDITSSCFLGAAFIAALYVVFMDRIRELDQSVVMHEAKVSNWSDEKIVQELQIKSYVAIKNNKEIIAVMRQVLALQILLSAVAGVIASVTLLTGA